MFNKILSVQSNTKKLINSINNKEKISVFGFTKNEQTSIFSYVEDPIVYVVSNYENAIAAKEQFHDLGKRVEVLNEGFLPNYSKLKNIELIRAVNAINKLHNHELDVVVVTTDVLLNKYPTLEKLNSNKIELESGLEYGLGELVKTLNQFGYRHQELVEEEGDFSKRGDIVDVFVKGQTLPFRLSFFGDELEFIRNFNVTTQITIKPEFDKISIPANNQDYLTYEEKENLRQNLLKQIASADNDDLQNIYDSVFGFNDYNSAWLNVFSSAITASFFDCLPKGSIVVFEEQKQVYDNIMYALQEKQTAISGLISENILLKQHQDFYIKQDKLFQFKQDLGLISFGNISTSNRIFAPHKVFNIKCINIPNYFANKNMLVYDVTQFYKQNYTQILFAKDEEFANSLKDLLSANGVNSIVFTARTQIMPQTVNIVTKTDNATFGILEEKLVIIGTSKLLKKQTEPKRVANKTENYQDLMPAVGEYVVHETHGIGKCISIEKITVNNLTKDYIILEYKNGDKLFLPVENIDSVTKYVGGQENPSLNKLGGAEFYKTKQKVKAELKETAFSLVELYAKRMSLKGICFPSDDEIQQEFEKEFIYTETPDQLTAIDDIKRDMQSEKVMDRLICGDVGYGKTELAMRAIFKAVLGGYQAAFLCPTTILSQQHFNSCVARMQNFGVNIAVLNRFKTQREVNQIITDVNSGKINILIGTHKILSKEIKFKNLGLLVIDEEQKFGVADKEKIKNIKSMIDVLTLSATPIPRSLHMALVGIRDISTIETPPPMKLPVVTQVVEERDELLKGAINYELARNGQVLIVFNNVFNIYNFYSHVKALVGDDVKIGVAHGQMSEHELENEIYNLYNGVTRILISTTLIENGIDLPSANTLIVVNSDMLGLSQLYQLKGRVGRGTVQGFAYFMYDHKKRLNEQAVKRLEAINEFTELGDGYKIAMKDLEIRGAGNVLGVKQHGHMAKVGYGMYVNLLKESVSELQGEKAVRNYEIKIDTDFNANLPNYYVSKTSARIRIYSDIAKLVTAEDIKLFVNNLQEIYGECPQEVYNLCNIACIKNVAKNLPIKRISIKLRELKIEFLETDDVLNQNIVKAAQVFKNNIVLNLNKLPIITINNFSGIETAFSLATKILNSFK